MPNLAAVIKQEILRLARKEVRSATAPLKEKLAQQHQEISNLKRQVADLQRKIQSLESRRGAVVGVPTTDEPDATIRFSPKSLRAHRKRLGMSAMEYAKLLNVSMQTVYHWEQGKSRPRRSLMVSLAAVRNLGKREAWRRIDAMSHTKPITPKIAAKKKSTSPNTTPSPGSAKRKAAKSPKKNSRQDPRQ